MNTIYEREHAKGGEIRVARPKAHMPPRLGIVGGIGWMATRLYYTELCRRSSILLSKHMGGTEHATIEMVIESLNLARGLAPQQSQTEASWADFDEYHRDALVRLEQAGVDVAVIASNTPHERFATITHGVQVPVINLFEELARYCRTASRQRVLVLGTQATMSSSTLVTTLRASGVEVVSPPTPEQRSAIVELIGDIQAGGASQEDRFRVASLVSQVGKVESYDAVVLGCTELPLAFSGSETLLEFEYEGVCYINSAMIHVEAALKAVFKLPPRIGAYLSDSSYSK